MVETKDLLPWIRPVLILICGILLLNLPTLLYKTRLALESVLYLVLCNDKSWKKPSDPGLVFQPLLKADKSNVQKKTIYFVRHGESTWNDTFNKGKHRSTLVFAVGFIPGLIKAILYEFYLILVGKIDSWFYDAPLSYLGLSQVKDLGQFLQRPPKENNPEGAMIAILRGDPGAPSSKLLCSSLRRAVSTMAAGFQERLLRLPKDKILIVPSLQEISRNPDTLSITPANTPLTASWIDKQSKVCDFQHIFSSRVDMSRHGGNKPINTNGLRRMNEFCDFVFNGLEEDHIVCGGHSIWFRSFFRTYLPYTMEHVSKKKKVVNCGIVAMTLMKATTGDGVRYMVDPSSIKVVYGGFA